MLCLFPSTNKTNNTTNHCKNIIMGAEWSKFNPSKRFKRGEDYTTLDAANKRTQHCLFTGIDWNRLPYLVLVQVFQHLDQTDRYHAALTCKSWLLALSSPAVWRTGHFKLNTKYDKYLLPFIRRMGKSFLHIRADGTGLRDVDIDISTRFLSLFLGVLIDVNNQKLVTLSLTNTKILWSTNAYLRWEVVEQLETLLENQHQLQVLDLSNADLKLYEGLDLLLAATLNSYASINTLHINGLVKEIFSAFVANDGKFHLVVSRLTNLCVLQLDYPYLSNTVLYLLAATASNTLQLMTVHRTYFYIALTRITSPAWQSLTSACPRLKIEFFIESNYGSWSEMSYMLVPSMPLHKLHWKCMLWLDEDCVSHIADNFQTIEHEKM
ncbi:F-box/LRR-repeat protein 21-like [Physella acuta]|uniref:F-box/LRR-repeat protein 21-like n=1 Tax=Physella acuta TaxID=109671 RepID=UPI0027DD9443|nr:F-box/LRR-repeat protein 21-like [Physella acuta]